MDNGWVYNTNIRSPEIAEIIEESGVENNLLKDSLDNIDESENFPSVSEEKRPEETIKEVTREPIVKLSIVSAVSEAVKNSEEERKIGNLKEHKKKHKLKPTEKNMGMLNKTTFSKGQPKLSYSELHQRKLHRSKTSSIPEKSCKVNMTAVPLSKNEHKSKQENRDVDEVVGIHQDEGDGLSLNLHHGLAMNSEQRYTSLQVNRSYQNITGLEINNKPINKELDLANCGPSNENRSRPSYMSPRSGVFINSDYLYQITRNTFHNDDKFDMNQEKHGVDPMLNVQSDNTSQFLPPIQEVPTSVRSAPADIHMYHNGIPHYELPNRANSVCTFGCKNTFYSSHGKFVDSITSLNSKGTVKPGVTSYSVIHAKQQTYQPYTLRDYKMLKLSTPGGLGPNTNSEEHKLKVKKAARQKEYAAILRQKHNSDNSPWKKKPVISVQERSQKVQEANARRKKALQYAKAVPKPTISTKNKTPEVKTEVGQQDTFTLLDILRQRHEKERKAIETVRRDLEAKLKTR